MMKKINKTILIKVFSLGLGIFCLLYSLDKLAYTYSFFSDTETSSMRLTVGTWEDEPEEPANLVINEVYYDVFPETEKCKEEKSEWIELYNPTDSSVNLQGWQVCHGGNCNTIHPYVSIPAYSFAIVGHDNSIWGHCFANIPDETIKIHQLGGEWVNLDNESDYVILKNVYKQEVDCVDWGGDGTCEFEDGSVETVAPGSSIARIEKGVDNDLASDWQELEAPNPGTSNSTENTDGSEESVLGKTTGTDDETLLPNVELENASRSLPNIKLENASNSTPGESD